MVVVFGSINVDLVLRVPRHPRPGETVLADRFEVSPGGKGANQAIAAARMGARVRMYGAVGLDAHGADMRSNLVRNGVDEAGVQSLADATTGCATITVDCVGQNAICVAAGANVKARAAIVPNDALGPESVVLAQMEVEPAENWMLLARARARGARTLLNLAPAADLNERTLDAIRKSVDFLVINECEALELLRAIRTAPESPECNAAALSRALNVVAIITLGVNGACAAQGSEIVRARPLPVEVVDTTGAGDCFVGVFAAMLDSGEPLVQALEAAAAAGSLACGGPGAQSAMPDNETLLRALR